MKKPYRVVVHGGRAHKDEVLTAMMAIPKFGITRIDRRDPTEEELEDPSVLVIDVGMRHQPEKNNFDHHQRDRDEIPECALSLFARHLILDGHSAHDILKMTKWYEPLIYRDVMGVKNLAERMGITTETVLGLNDPISNGILQVFESRAEWAEGDSLFMVLRRMGINLLDYLGRFMSRQKALDELCRIVHVEGIPGFYMESSDIEGTGLWRERNAPGTAFSIAWDQRGDGMKLFRFDDDERIDFTALEGKEGVAYVANSGFMATTVKRLNETEAKALVALAIAK